LKEFEYREKLLDPTSPEAYRLTLDRKRLQSLAWDAAAPFMNALDPKFAAPQPVAVPPTKPATPPVESDPEAPEDEPPSMPAPAPTAEPSTPVMDWIEDEEEINIYDTL
jgi:hypothetical protein